MPKFLIERHVPGAARKTDAEWKEAARISAAVLRDMAPRVQWLLSYVAGDKLYCVYYAEDAEAVREHSRRTGFPADAVTPIARTLDPATAEQA